MPTASRPPKLFVLFVLACLMAAAWLVKIGNSDIAAQKRPRLFVVYPIWLAGAAEQDRMEIDAFLRCLTLGSNLNHYWRGEVRLIAAPSIARPAPKPRLRWPELAAWLDQLHKSGAVRSLPGEHTPLYLVFGGEPTLWVGACGRNAKVVVARHEAGLGVVRTAPLCWATGNRIRTETQIATHEIVETIDRVLGYGTCAGGGACRARSVCPDPCDTFVGLNCKGAPRATFTGCDGGRVVGWVVQKFSHDGRIPGRCDTCATCDFTPTVCLPANPDCAALPEWAP